MTNVIATIPIANTHIYPAQNAICATWQRCQNGDLPPCRHQIFSIQFVPVLAQAFILGFRPLSAPQVRGSNYGLDILLGGDARSGCITNPVLATAKPALTKLVAGVLEQRRPLAITLSCSLTGSKAVLTLLRLLDSEGNCTLAPGSIDISDGQICGQLKFSHVAPFSPS